MTLDEAIEYYINVATQRAIADEENGVNDNSKWNETKFMTKKESEQIIADNLQLAEWLNELKEAKRLLKAAVEDIHELLCDKKNLDGNGQSCNICSHIEWCSCRERCTIREDLRNWRFADEALALIGGSENG